MESVMCIFYEKGCLAPSSACTKETEKNCPEAEKRKALHQKNCPLMDSESYVEKVRKCDIDIVRQITPVDIACNNGRCLLRKVDEVRWFLAKKSTEKTSDYELRKIRMAIIRELRLN